MPSLFDVPENYLLFFRFSLNGPCRPSLPKVRAPIFLPSHNVHQIMQNRTNYDAVQFINESSRVLAGTDKSWSAAKIF